MHIASWLEGIKKTDVATGLFVGFAFFALGFFPGKGEEIPGGMHFGDELLVVLDQGLFRIEEQGFFFSQGREDFFHFVEGEVRFGFAVFHAGRDEEITPESGHRGKVGDVFLLLVGEFVVIGNPKGGFGRGEEQREFETSGVVFRGVPDSPFGLDDFV